MRVYYRQIVVVTKGQHSLIERQTMNTTNANDVLEFKVNFRVTKKVRKGFLGLGTKTDDCVILNDGKTRTSRLHNAVITEIRCSSNSERKNRVGHDDSAFRREVINQ